MFIDWSIGLEKLRAIDIAVSADGVGAGAVLDGAADEQAVVITGTHGRVRFFDSHLPGAGQVVPAGGPGKTTATLNSIQNCVHGDFCGAFIGVHDGGASCLIVCNALAF